MSSLVSHLSECSDFSMIESFFHGYLKGTRAYRTIKTDGAKYYKKSGMTFHVADHFIDITGTVGDNQVHTITFYTDCAEMTYELCMKRPNAPGYDVRFARVRNPSMQEVIEKIKSLTRPYMDMEIHMR